MFDLISTSLNSSFGLDVSNILGNPQLGSGLSKEPRETASGTLSKGPRETAGGTLSKTESKTQSRVLKC